MQYYFLCVSTSCAKLLQLYLTLCNPTDCSLPSSSVNGILQARILEWVAISSTRGSSCLGITPRSLMSPALAGGFFTISTTWEAHKSTIFQYKIKSKLKIKKKNVGLEVLLKSEISLLSTFLPYPPRREFLPPFRGPLSPLTHCSQGRHTLL